MERIEVQTISEDPGGFRFAVTVGDGMGATSHQVTLSRADFERWGTTASPEPFIRRCFEFVLEREPKESILSRFDVSDIGRYFPEFAGEIGRPEA